MQLADAVSPQTLRVYDDVGAPRGSHVLHAFRVECVDDPRVFIGSLALFFVTAAPIFSRPVSAVKSRS